MAAARASAGPRDRLVVELLARTGMRAGEPAGLDADAVVLIGAGHWLRIPLGKLRNDRYVPLDPELVQLPAAWTAANLEHIRRHKRLIAGPPRPAGPVPHRPHRRPRRPGSRGPRRAPPPAPAHPGHPGHQPRHAAGGHRRPARPPQDGDDPDLRPDRQPRRRRRVRRRQRQDRRALRPVPAAARRLREHRHGPDCAAKPTP
jgi:hypothetical protein